MKISPRLIFGYRAALVTADPGDTSPDLEYDTNGAYNGSDAFYLSGVVKIQLASGVQLPDRLPGRLNSEQPAFPCTGGIGHFTYPELSDWVCFTRIANKNTLPTISSLVLNVNEQVVLANNSNIYLARGVVTLNGKNFTGPCHIRLRSGSATATSVDKSYSLVFPTDPTL